MFAAALLNAGPIAASLLKTSDAENALVSQLSTGVIIARVPLFLFQAVQAALLPKLARLAARGALDDFVRGFRKLLMLVLVVSVVAVVGAFLLGPFVVRVFFDSELSRRTLTLLALSSSLYMIALALAQAIIALRGHAKVAVGWMIGMLAFIVVVADPQRRPAAAGRDGPRGRVVRGAWWCSASCCGRMIRTGVEPDEESLIEALDAAQLKPVSAGVTAGRGRSSPTRP